jgi:hypothetical protein
MNILGVLRPLSLATLLAFSNGCDEKSSTKEGSQKSAEEKAVEQKATVDALLRQNGIDPTTLPTAPGSEATTAQPGVAAPAADAAQGAANGPVGGAPPQATVALIKPGQGPKKVLRYQFQKGRKRNFAMDMEVVATRVVNGQPTPGTPPITISMSGTSLTVAADDQKAQRENTFLNFTPSSEGLPPMMVEQMKAQFGALKGIQLVETVSTQGQILDLSIKEESVTNPEALALVQNLQDGMSNAFLALPAEAVGVGAEWKGTSTITTAGLNILQENTVVLKSLNGNRATVEVTFKQSAGKQILDAPGLPPGAQVELVSMEGGGTGTVTVDFSTLVTDSKSSLRMAVDTKISGAAPEPILSATDTTMKIHMRVTQ